MVTGSCDRLSGLNPLAGCARELDSEDMDERVVVRQGGPGKSFGPALAQWGVDLKVGRGQVLDCLGPQGIARTRTLRLSKCMLRPNTGRASASGLDDEPDPAAVHRRVGYLPPVSVHRARPVDRRPVRGRFRRDGHGGGSRAGLFWRLPPPRRGNLEPAGPAAGKPMS
jgi:hypothetical protein